MFFKYLLIFLCTFISLSKSDHRRSHGQNLHSISNLISNKIDDQVQMDSNRSIDSSVMNKEEKLAKLGSYNQSSEISFWPTRYTSQ